MYACSACQLFTPSCDTYRYTDIFVGTPKVEEEYIQADITPQQCRLRDMTYSAPVSVDIEYTRGKEVIVKKGKNGVGAVTIGRLPLMLRSGRYFPKSDHLHEHRHDLAQFKQVVIKATS